MSIDDLDVLVAISRKMPRCRQAKDASALEDAVIEQCVSVESCRNSTTRTYDDEDRRVFADAHDDAV